MRIRWATYANPMADNVPDTISFVPLRVDSRNTASLVTRVALVMVTTWTVAACDATRPECASNRTSPDPRPNADSTHDVRFITYDETTNWRLWRDPRLSMHLPADWNIALDPDMSKDGNWTYVLNDVDDEGVFTISVTRGGPEWAATSCIPKSAFAYTEKPPFKFWAVIVDFRPNVPGGRAYGFRVASRSLRLDIKAGLEDRKGVAKHDPQQVIYIAQSARTIEPDGRYQP